MPSQCCLRHLRPGRFLNEGNYGFRPEVVGLSYDGGASNSVHLGKMSLDVAGEYLVARGFDHPFGAPGKVQPNVVYEAHVSRINLNPAVDALHAGAGRAAECGLGW
jgi:hypothetical protein